VPLLAYWLARAPDSITVDPRAQTGDDLVISYARPEVARLLSVVPRPPVQPGPGPPGARRVFGNDSWIVRAAC
jgi:hypothetical protein